MKTITSVALATILVACVPDHTPPQTKACKQVLQELVFSPSTLDILKITAIGYNNVTISYDVQNAFGAIVRGELVCWFPDTDHKSTELVSLQLNGSLLAKSDLERLNKQVARTLD